MRRLEAREGMGAGMPLEGYFIGYEEKSLTTSKDGPQVAKGVEGLPVQTTVAGTVEGNGHQELSGSLFGPRFGPGERLNLDLVAHRQTVATAVYVDELNTYVPREDLVE